MIMALLVSLASFANLAKAQSQFIQGQDNLLDLKVGPLFTAGAAVNAGDVATGTKTSPAFAYTPGALFDFTYTSQWGFDLGLVYDARQINFHDAANSSVGVNYDFGYLALRPELRFGGFLIGVGLGLPVSAGATASNGAVAPKVTTGDMSALFEGRIGGTVELLRSNARTLNFTVEGSYAFSKNLDSSWFHAADATKNNGPLATVQVGLNYLFDLFPQTEMPAVAIAHGR